MTGKFLLLKRGLFYRPDAAGYTGIKEKAGRYDLTDAMSHTDPISGVTMIAEELAPEFSPECCLGVKAEHLMRQRDEARRERDALIAALTPSEETKARLSGEFRVSAPGGRRRYLIEWTTIKAIMTAIREMAQ